MDHVRVDNSHAPVVYTSLKLLVQTVALVNTTDRRDALDLILRTAINPSIVKRCLDEQIQYLVL